MSDFQIEPEADGFKVTPARKAATVEVLTSLAGLTPQQVLAASLYDRDVNEIECVVVVSVLKNGIPLINWSTMTAGNMAYLLAIFQHQVMKTLDD